MWSTTHSSVIVHMKKTIAQLKVLFNCALIKSLVRIVIL
jgi:hypothetical protein